MINIGSVCSLMITPPDRTLTRAVWPTAAVPCSGPGPCPPPWIWRLSPSAVSCGSFDLCLSVCPLPRLSPLTCTPAGARAESSGDRGRGMPRHGRSLPGSGVWREKWHRRARRSRTRGQSTGTLGPGPGGPRSTVRDPWWPDRGINRSFWPINR